MTTLEILRAARALIAQPGRWCQGHMALTASGYSVMPEHEDACKFCTFGAIRRVVVGPTVMARRAVDELSVEARRMLGAASYAVHLNDTTDLPTVLAMFDATIARLEGQG